ncbi:Toll/interleukin-1 receptor domain-containing protein [Tanacetum coccineum]
MDIMMSKHDIQSEEYIEVSHEDDENNHSNVYAKWGLTRLCRFAGIYGDMVLVRHIGLQIYPEESILFNVDLTIRKLVMNRLGQLLRNFRRKLRQTYILPNQDTPSKLNEVPAKYTAILKAEDWVNFVNYTATEEYKVKSAKAKMARSKLKKKEIEQDEEPTRGTLWLKGRVNKDGEYQDDEIRSVGDKLKTKGQGIKEGTFQVDQGTDAMTLVLGKGKGSQLDAARREREEKELLIKSMSSKMSQTEGMVTKLKNQLAAQGGQLQSTPTQLTPLDVSPVEIHPINSSADEEGGTTVVGCDQNDASIRKEMQKRAIKCRLWHLKKTTIIAEGTVYKSDGKIMLHNKALPKDCYKVSIDKSLVDAAFIPDVGSNGCTTVLDAVGGFVAWPKNQVVLDPKELRLHLCNPNNPSIKPIRLQVSRRHHLDAPATIETSNSTIDPLHESNVSLVVMWMYSTISPKLVEMVVDDDTSAHGIWKRLKDLFHNNKDAQVTQLDNEIRNMAIDSLSVIDFFQEIESKADRLANLDSPVKDTSLVTYAVNVIRSKYPDAAHVIRLQEKSPTFDELWSMMLLEKSDISHKSVSSTLLHNTPSSPTVLVSSTTPIDKENTMSTSGFDVCRNFQHGSCSYGAHCKFVHGANDC